MQPLPVLMARAELPRELWRRLRADPEHAPERLLLLVAERLGEPTRAWAERAMAAGDPRRIAERERVATVRLARVNGALAGTPFLLAFVPAYVAFLLDEARFVLRLGALAGRDPTDRRRVAEMLALRHLYPDPDAALAALDALPAEREKGAGRRGIKVWWRVVYQLLILGGFLSPGEGKTAPSRRDKAKRAGVAVMGAGIWILTWVIPITFMLVMSWSCDSDSRRLGRGALAYYGLEHEESEAERLERKAQRTLRDTLRAIAIALSVLLPVSLVGTAVALQPLGLDWIRGLGALLGLAMVLALVSATRRRAPAG